METWVFNSIGVILYKTSVCIVGSARGLIEDII